MSEQQRTIEALKECIENMRWYIKDSHADARRGLIESKNSTDYILYLGRERALQELMTVMNIPND